MAFLLLIFPVLLMADKSLLMQVGKNGPKHLI